ncbi:MAG: YbjN domain-containing protein [Rhodobacteraceae bacterium]|nr:YbjN domain-containing protein [Paracoccaceae bacterium]
MSDAGFVLNSGIRNPIAVAELLAEDRNWDFKRQSEDEIVVTLEGQWKIYTASLCWSEPYGILSIECSFGIELSGADSHEFLKTLNMANMRSWLGSFTYEENPETVVYSYRLALEDEVDVSSRQVECILDTIVADCDRFYPSLDLARLGRLPAAESLAAAIIETRGVA